MQLTQEHTLTPINALKPHPDNPRQGDIGAIHESITHNGFYGTIIVQKSTGYILAGNHRWQAAKAAGLTEIPVTYLDVNDDHARRILLADNRTNDLATYNDEALAQLLQELHDTTGTLDGTGYDGDDLDQLLSDLEHDPLATPDPAENPYTQTVNSPIYEPTTEEPPHVTQLTDRTTTEALKQEIRDANLNDPDIEAFLLAAAERHTIHDYQQIAEYYAHAPAHIQRLMEASALIIIDYNQALERGFVTLSQRLTDLYEHEHPVGSTPEPEDQLE